MCWPEINLATLVTLSFSLGSIALAPGEFPKVFCLVIRPRLRGVATIDTAAIAELRRLGRKDDVPGGPLFPRQGIPPLRPVHSTLFMIKLFDNDSQRLAISHR